MTTEEMIAAYLSTNEVTAVDSLDEKKALTGGRDTIKQDYYGNITGREETNKVKYLKAKAEMKQLSALIKSKAH